MYRYESPAGAVQFHSDGAFSAEFAPGALPLGEDWEKSCRAYLADMEFQGQLLEREGDRFTFRQLWEGVPLFSQQVTLVCQDGCLVGMAGGRRLAGQPQPDLSRTPITVPTALFGFLNGLSALGDVCSRIDTVEEGYVAAVSLPGPTVLTPVWHITTDTGAYQLDTLTGEVTRVS
ncbi:MAG: hypothetical protein HFF44_10450 [Lawsonibacter sp.]|nr:hypothetical protein [Lawsonibacter sp.]